MHIRGCHNTIADTISRLHQPGQLYHLCSLLRTFYNYCHPTYFLPDHMSPLSCSVFMPTKVGQLDKEVATLRQYTFAPSTKNNYRSQLKCYLEFCSEHALQPVPASPLTICRYIAFLARSKTFGTIQQYLLAIRILHLESGLRNPSEGQYQIQSLMRAVKRVKGCEQRYKQTLSLKQIHSLYHQLDMSHVPDIQLWAIITACFYGLLPHWISHGGISAKHGTPGRC